MIKPGLERITKLLDGQPLPWRAIHVAGTNGKGSVCHYVKNMLMRYNSSRMRKLEHRLPLKIGMYTSPHLVDRWDGIHVSHVHDLKEHYLAAEDVLLKRSRMAQLSASEFEITTAAAFKIFTELGIDVGIIETGMGGRHDATNILGLPAADADVTRAPPLVTAITKIGMDHQGFLGNTLEEIADHKAGIIKPDVPVVYDLSNDGLVKQVIQSTIAKVGAREVSIGPWEEVLTDAFETTTHAQAHAHPVLPAHAQQNMTVAMKTTLSALVQLDRLQYPAALSASRFEPDMLSLVEQMANVADTTSIPGRLEQITLKVPMRDGTEQELDMLLDGAHNAQSADVLANRVATMRDCSTGQLCWIMAMSEGRDIQELLRPLLLPRDRVATVEFGPVDAMPWIKPVSADTLKAAVELVIAGRSPTPADNVEVVSYGDDLLGALQHAVAVANGARVVAAGSLYLVGAIHKLLQQGVVGHVSSRFKV